ncbi:MAG: VCBS repeat-containing protein, partial [Thermoplasmatales archaeon]
MKNNCIKKSVVIALIFILIFSTISSLAISKNTEINNPNKNKIMVTFIEKSTGLNNPEKEGGKTELELADINNDGHLDIICVGDHGSPYVNSQQHGIMVWLGDGIDTWSVNQVGNFGYGGIEAGDLNLDGYLDIVWGVHHDWGVPGFGDTLIGAALGDGTATNWIPWAEGLGTGGEDWGMFATDLADFDCNGLLDIISQSFGCCNGYHMYENHGDGTWSHEWAVSGGNTYNNIEIGDFNSDGYPDFVGNREGTYVYLGDGSLGFTLTQNGLPTSSWRGLDVGDMNNDGYDDLVVGFYSTGVKCYTYDKQNNKWESASSGLPSSGTYYPQFGDIDGDGFLDIVAYTSTIGTLYLGDGNGNWDSDATFSMPSTGDYSAFVVDGDFDHDGREDIVIQAEEGDWISYQNILKAFSPYQEPSELSALLQSPNGGETLISGSIRKIRWLSGVPPSQGDSTVEIQISLNGESGPWDTIVAGIPNNGCYQWLV